jgi:histidine ammonia-lyase
VILLDGESFTLDDLVAVAYGDEQLSLSDIARDRVRAARAVVDQAADHDTPAYGINTGFGNFANVRIPHDSLAELQLNLLRSHAAGVGDPLPVPVVRATMALRANVLAKGFSGIRVETLELLLAMINRRVHPVVPSRGSVGASGDLAPLAHLGLVLIGEGEAWRDGAGACGSDAGLAGTQRRIGPDQRHPAIHGAARPGAGRGGTAGASGRYRGGAQY